MLTQATMQTNLLPDTLTIAVICVCGEIRVLCPISGSNDSCKRHEFMRLISKLGTVHPLDINERFSNI